MPATVNLVPNPSFEQSLDHYTTVGGATIVRTGVDPLYGEACLDYSTPGTTAAQGFRLADVTPQTSGTHTGSIHLRGAGVVDLQLVTNPGGVVRATQTIGLTSTWARYSVTGTVPSGATVYLLVVSHTSTLVTGLADGLQIEAGTLTDYCDGDRYGCHWLGTPDDSISVREVPYPIIAAGHSQSDGTLAMYPSGPVQISAHGASASTGLLTTATANPVGCLDDFAVWSLTEPDPIYGYAIRGTEGISSGSYGSDWVRVYTHFVVPRSYRASDGDIGTRAAYAECGVRFDNLPANKKQHLDRVQLEINDVQSRTPPTAYTPPRQLQVIVKPARLNFAKNPSFTVDTALWTMHGTCTLTRDTTLGIEATSPASGRINITGTTPDTYIEHNIDALIPGRNYLLSAYVRWEAGVNDVWVELPNAGIVQSTIEFSTETDIPYGAGGYGEGEYGGDETFTIPINTWIRVYFPFQAAYQNESIRFSAKPNGAAGVGKHAWIDQLLIEDTTATSPGTYFDGSYGDDYLWETGGTAHQSRTYYYPQILNKIGVINDLVASSVPLGITAADPQFAVPYIQ